MCVWDCEPSATKRGHVPHAISDDSSTQGHSMSIPMDFMLIRYVAYRCCKSGEDYDTWSFHSSDVSGYTLANHHALAVHSYWDKSHGFYE